MFVPLCKVLWKDSSLLFNLLLYLYQKVVFSSTQYTFPRPENMVNRNKSKVIIYIMWSRFAIYNYFDLIEPKTEKIDFLKLFLFCFSVKKIHFICLQYFIKVCISFHLTRIDWRTVSIIVFTWSFEQSQRISDIRL